MDISIGGDLALAGIIKHSRGLDEVRGGETDGGMTWGKKGDNVAIPSACHSDTAYNVGCRRPRSIPCNLYKMAGTPLSNVFIDNITLISRK